MGDHGFVNHLAVIACAVSTMVLGGIWYSPALFYKAWREGADVRADKPQGQGHPGKVYGGATVAAWLGAYIFAYVLGRSPSVAHSTLMGLSVGLAIVAGSFAINYLFENKSMKYFLVNAGYHTVQYTIWGFILGAMQ